MLHAAHRPRQVEESSRTTTAHRPSATVAICAYTMRRWKILERVVTAVSGQLDPGDELIVVSDHSAELYARASEATVSLPQVRVIPNTRSRGLSGARNTAIDAASGEILVFLDDDAVPRPEWLERLLAPYKDDRVIGVGGYVAADWSARKPRWFPPEFLWVVGCSYSGLPAEGSAIRNPIGANMSFRRSAFAQVGEFSESLGRIGTVPVGCEETEFSIRLLSGAGSSRIVFHPSSVVDHLVPPERARFHYFSRRCWSEGRSKAAVAKTSGSRTALSSERHYVGRTLASALVRELAALLRGQIGGAARAGVIVFGTLVTAAGYVYGTWSGRGVPHTR